MIMIIVGMTLCAVLFVIFTAARPRRECSGNCGACHGSCELAGKETGGNDVR